MVRSVQGEASQRQAGPAPPPQSTLSQLMSPAMGHIEPTSSSRARRSAQPTGRGLSASIARMASISSCAMICPGLGHAADASRAYFSRRERHARTAAVAMYSATRKATTSISDAETGC